MITKRSMFIWSLVTVGAMACSGDDGNGGGALTAEEATQESLRLNCEKAHECKASVPAGFDFEAVFGASVTACIPIAEGHIGDVAASIAAGRVTFHAAMAQTCLDELSAQLDALSCSALWSGTSRIEPASCSQAFVGSVAVDGACFSGMDCAGDLVCAVTSLSDYPGTCVMPD